MKVRAKETGYDGWATRQEGEVFELRPGHKIAHWMEKVGNEEPVSSSVATPEQDEEVKTPAPKKVPPKVQTKVEPKATPAAKPGRAKKDVI